MNDRKEYFKLYNKKPHRKKYLNQKGKERYHKLKKIEQQEGGEIKKVLNNCKECGTTYLLVKKNN
ncbi:MAG: hypothetical protein NY202_03250 [Mollicutes bacterium UO1]